MKFSRKVFLGIFSPVLLVGTVLIWGTHHIVSENASESYLSRYVVFSQVLGRTLSQLERNTEALMRNAAEVVAGEEARRGVSTDDQLRELAKQLSVTHIFEINSAGNFIRSTNEDPKLIPNVFSFCGKYRELFSGPRSVIHTPIIPPTPEPNPYKFLFVRSHDGMRLIETGVRVDYVGKTLTNAINDDSNVMAINLYTPDGTTLGSFSKSDSKYQRTKVQLPNPVEGVIQESDRFRIFSKVDSGQLHCCQCDVSGISKNGEYYYVFESIISKRKLAATLASIRNLFWLLQLLTVVLAVLVARFLASRLVGKVQYVAKKVKEMGIGTGSSMRINLKGDDEIAYLASEFDGLLTRLDQSQEKILQSKKSEAVAEIASQVSHNIRSPLASLENLLPRLSGLVEKDRNIFRNAVKEIMDLANRLKAQSTELRRPAASSAAVKSSAEESSVQLLSSLIDYTVSEKREQFKDKQGIEISAPFDEISYGLFAKVQPTEFRTLLSNLINNAVESIDGSTGKVTITGQKVEAKIILSQDYRLSGLTGKT